MIKKKIVLYEPRRTEFESDTNWILPVDLLAACSLLDLNRYEIKIFNGGIDPEAKARAVEACEDALCFGVTSIISYQVADGFDTAQAVRARHPNLPVVWGGWFPSVAGAQIVEEGIGDVAVVGQGEETFRDLAEAFDSGSDLAGIPGIIYRSVTGETVTNPTRPMTQLDDLPPVPYHLIDVESYIAPRSSLETKFFLSLATGESQFHREIRPMVYMTSWGCPERCTFCCAPGITPRWSALSPERVLDDLAVLVDRYQANLINFCDANFLIHEKRVRALCEGMIDRQLGFNWATSAEARMINRFSEETMALLKQSGCYGFYIGAESGDAATLDAMKKKMDPKDTEEAVAKLARNDMVGLVSYIVGMPGETPESVDRTIRQACTLLTQFPGNTGAQVHYFRPLPGTELYARALESGFEEPKSVRDWGTVSYDRGIGRWVSPRQARAIERCGKFYIPWSNRGRWKGAQLTTLERLIRWSAFQRLRLGFFDFPFEHRLLSLARR